MKWNNEVLLFRSKHWVTVQHVIELGDGVPAREKHLQQAINYTITYMYTSILYICFQGSAQENLSGGCTLAEVVSNIAFQTL